MGNIKRDWSGVSYRYFYRCFGSGHKLDAKQVVFRRILAAFALPALLALALYFRPARALPALIGGDTDTPEPTRGYETATPMPPTRTPQPTNTQWFTCNSMVGQLWCTQTAQANYTLTPYGTPASYGTEYPTSIPLPTAIPVCTRAPSTPKPTETHFWDTTPLATCRPGFCPPGTNEPTETATPCPTNLPGTGTPGACQPTKTPTITATATKTATATATLTGLLCPTSNAGGVSCKRLADGSLEFSVVNYSCGNGVNTIISVARGSATGNTTYFRANYIQVEYNTYAQLAGTQLRYKRFSGVIDSALEVFGNTSTTATVSNSGSFTAYPDSGVNTSRAEIQVAVSTNGVITGCNINGVFWISTNSGLLTGTPTPTGVPSATATITPTPGGCIVDTSDPNIIIPDPIISNGGCYNLTQDILVSIPDLPSIGGIDIPGEIGVPRTTVCLHWVTWNLSIFGIDIFQLLGMGMSLWMIIQIWKEFRQ